MKTHVLNLCLIVLSSSLVTGCCIGNCKVDKNQKEDVTTSNNPVSETPKNPTKAQSCQKNITQKAMLDAVNKARSEGRRCGGTFYRATTKLSWNGHLAKSASLHAVDMANNNYFSHTSQDGRKMKDRITNAGYTQYRYIAENISAGHSSIDSTIESWLNSENHCKNLMNPNFTDFAMACAANPKSKHKYYWVQNFGKR